MGYHHFVEARPSRKHYRVHVLTPFVFSFFFVREDAFGVWPRRCDDSAVVCRRR